MAVLNLKVNTSKPRNLDPYYQAACANVRAAFKDLLDRGIVDEQGRCIMQDLPEDMREGSDRDEGG